VLRDKIRAVTSWSRTERPVAAVVAELNPVLRGWAGYFRNGNSGRKFNAVDGYVHERLAIFASRKHGLRGRNWATRYTQGWATRLGVCRLSGACQGSGGRLEVSGAGCRETRCDMAKAGLLEAQSPVVRVRTRRNDT
jgi:RNA-directed DNA polymerase